MTDANQMVSVRYMVDDVQAALDFYTRHLGFEVLTHFGGAFADVARGNLRLLLSGPASSAGRPMPDGEKPGPGGWNRIHLIVDDIQAEVARLHAAGAPFRNEILSGPGGQQILLQDPSGNLVELFQPRAFIGGQAGTLTGITLGLAHLAAQRFGADAEFLAHRPNRRPL